MKKPNIVTTQTETEIKSIPWNKADLKNNKKSFPIKIFLSSIIFIALVLSLFFMNVSLYLSPVINNEPTYNLNDFDEAWLKKNLNLANLPFDQSYIENQDNSIIEPDNKNNLEIIPDINETEANISHPKNHNTLPQDMLIEHAPEQYINIVIEKNNLN